MIDTNLGQSTHPGRRFAPEPFCRPMAASRFSDSQYASLLEDVARHPGIPLRAYLARLPAISLLVRPAIGVNEQSRWLIVTCERDSRDRHTVAPGHVPAHILQSVHSVEARWFGHRGARCYRWGFGFPLPVFQAIGTPFNLPGRRPGMRPLVAPSSHRPDFVTSSHRQRS